MDMMFNTEMIVKDMKGGKEDMTEKRYTTMWKPETTFSRFWIVRENWERKLNANDVVDLLNEQHEQIERLKDNFKVLDEVKCELADENEQLKRSVQYWYAEHKRIVNNYVDKIKEVEKENEQLKQQLKSIEDSFKFSCTENHIEFNKDKLKVEDTHTKLTLKDGKLCIYVFIPQLNEYVKFFYLVTGRKMEREFINYDGDV